jgi:hypothetical protein
MKERPGEPLPLSAVPRQRTRLPADDRCVPPRPRRETLPAETRLAAVAVPSGCVVIDQDELLESVGAVYDAGKSAHAINVRIELGDIADDRWYFDVMDVADDLAELESLGKLSRVPAVDWGGSEPPPKTRIPYRPS